MSIGDDIQNIILIMNDDLAEWALGCYGNSEIYSPTLDYLARTGIQMSNAFTPTPVCSPARACCLTGRTASQHGIHDYLVANNPDIHRHPWLKDETTLAQVLSDSGYQTAHCGKWHLGNDDQPHDGFDYWFSGVGDYPAEHGGDHRFSINGDIQTIAGHRTQVITDKAIDFLHHRNPKQSFFMHISYFGTHNPWQGQPERLVEQYRNNNFDAMLEQPAYPFGHQNLESTLPTRLNPRESLAQYFASVTHIDESIGRLIDALEAYNLRDNTLLIFTSDHGLCCGHHGLWGKGNATLPLNMLEESIRIPMIFNQPSRLFARQKRTEFVDHLDLFQTIIDYAGLSEQLPDHRDYAGRSFLPLLDNSDYISDWRQQQFCEYGNVRMIRTDRYKLVKRYYEDAPCELFDLQSDPDEMINLFDVSHYQPIVSQLTTQMETHFGQFQDEEKSGLRVADLPQHNYSEAWRGGGR